MTPEQENALVLPLFDKRDHGDGTYTSFVPTEDDVRLAIRAAVAAERERCAKVCEEWIECERPVYLAFDPLKGWFRQRKNEECAAAIRRGE